MLNISYLWNKREIIVLKIYNKKIKKSKKKYSNQINIKKEKISE